MWKLSDALLGNGLGDPQGLVGEGTRTRGGGVGMGPDHDSKHNKKTLTWPTHIVFGPHTLCLPLPPHIVFGPHICVWPHTHAFGPHTCVFGPHTTKIDETQ